MKILFLDVDGVLNTDKHIDNNKEKLLKLDPNSDEYALLMLDPKLIEKLNKVVARTGCKVVVSSSWRRFFSDIDHLSFLLKKQGFTGEIIGYTPCKFSSYNCRGAEINWWLEDHPEVDAFVAVDDNPRIMGSMLKHSVITDANIGITDADVEKLISCLNKK